MSSLVIRLIVLLLVALLAWLLVWSGRRFVESRRQRVLSALPTTPASLSLESASVDNATVPQIRILAFSSDDCRQCHTLQTPVLKRVLEAKGDVVSVIDVDAPSSPELTQQYQVLTVPTTVILDATGKAHAVNYGFINAQRLLTQIDEVLAGTTA